MTSIDSYRLRGSMLLSVLLAFIFTPLTFSQTETRNRFIVAFELSEAKSLNFTWPYESMRSAPYDRVLIKVKKMPRVFDEHRQLSRPLRATRYLKINGAFQRPLRVRTAESGEQFEVTLHQGRLKFSLSKPERTTFDPQYKIARIEVYEINKPRHP
jgi:hypothetical protein